MKIRKQNFPAFFLAHPQITDLRQIYGLYLFIGVSIWLSCLSSRIWVSEMVALVKHGLDFYWEWVVKAEYAFK